MEDKTFPLVMTDNSFEQYQKRLGFSLEDLGKTSLDLGSGISEKFSKEASSLDIEVVSVNPLLVEEWSKNRAKLPHQGVPWQERSVAGNALQLPFADESFDSVVSLNAVPLYLKPNEEEHRQAFQEIYRVLKKNGKAFIGVIPKRSFTMDVQILNDLGYKHSLHQIPPEETDQITPLYSFQIIKAEVLNVA